MPDSRGVDPVRIHGLREFRRELVRLGPELPAELKQANLDAAVLVADAAKRRAPRGPHEGGGRVAPIWTQIRPTANQGKGFVQTGNAAAPHAVVYEFGGHIPRRGVEKSASRAARKAKRSFASFGVSSLTRVRAQPYLYPALDASRDEVLEFYGEAIDRLTRRAFPDRGFL